MPLTPEEKDRLARLTKERVDLLENAGLFLEICEIEQAQMEELMISESPGGMISALQNRMEELLKKAGIYDKYFELDDEITLLKVKEIAQDAPPAD